MADDDIGSMMKRVNTSSCVGDAEGAAGGEDEATLSSTQHDDE
jgi:hypothetical protein